MVGTLYKMRDLIFPTRGTPKFGSASLTRRPCLWVLLAALGLSSASVSGVIAQSMVPTASTGLFKGAFTPGWTPAPKALPAFQGVLLQKGDSPAGHGFFLSNRLGDTDPESGRVILQAPAPAQ